MRSCFKTVLSFRFPLQVRAQLPLLEIESGLNKIRRNLQPPVPDSLLELGFRLTEPQYWHLTQCFGNDSMFAGICGTEADQTLSLVFISEEMKQFMSSRRLVCSHLYTTSCYHAGVVGVKLLCNLVSRFSLMALRGKNLKNLPTHKFSVYMVYGDLMYVLLVILLPFLATKLQLHHFDYRVYRC